MQDNNEPMMGYPVEFLMVQSGDGRSGHRTIATATIPFSLQSTPTYDDVDTLPHESRWCCCLRNTLLVATAALILTIIAAVFWVLSLEHDPKFQINSVTVSSFNVSSSYINANWNISFSVKNPNMAVSLHYEDVRVSVLYDGVHLLSANIPQFHQYSLEETSVQANVTMTSVSINKSVAKAVAVARGHGYLDFTVTVDGSIRIVFSIRKEKRSKIRVSCEDLKVRFSANTTVGKTLDGSKECNVNM